VTNASRSSRADDSIPRSRSFVVLSHDLGDLLAHVGAIQSVALHRDEPLEVDEVFAAKKEKLEDRQSLGGEEPVVLAVDGDGDPCA
jgi:hypothetical protein